MLGRLDHRGSTYLYCISECAAIKKPKAIAFYERLARLCRLFSENINSKNEWYREAFHERPFFDNTMNPNIV